MCLFLLLFLVYESYWRNKCVYIQPVVATVTQRNGTIFTCCSLVYPLLELAARLGERVGALYQLLNSILHCWGIVPRVPWVPQARGRQTSISVLRSARESIGCVRCCFACVGVRSSIARHSCVAALSATGVFGSSPCLSRAKIVGIPSVLLGRMIHVSVTMMNVFHSRRASSRGCCSRGRNLRGCYNVSTM